MSIDGKATVKSAHDRIGVTLFTDNDMVELDPTQVHELVGDLLGRLEEAKANKDRAPSPLLGIETFCGVITECGERGDEDAPITVAGCCLSVEEAIALHAWLASCLSYHARKP